MPPPAACWAAPLTTLPAPLPFFPHLPFPTKRVARHRAACAAPRLFVAAAALLKRMALLLRAAHRLYPPPPPRAPRTMFRAVAQEAGGDVLLWLPELCSVSNLSGFLLLPAPPPHALPLPTSLSSTLLPAWLTACLSQPSAHAPTSRAGQDRKGKSTAQHTASTCFHH